MPNISLDIFFDNDILNVTASRSRNTPRVKPAWKVRSAPKLPVPEGPDQKTQRFGPKSQAKLPASSTPQKAAVPKSSKTPAASKPDTAATKDTENQPKKIPKLPPKSRPQPKTQTSSE